MAKVIFSALVEDVRGKIGGNVFSRNANGSFVRGYSKPVNADTEAQQSVRNQFGAIARSWRELTNAQRQSFIDQAVNYPYNDSLGRPQVYTGFQLFQKLNSQLILIGLDPISVIGAPVAMPAVATAVMNTSLAADLSTALTYTESSGGQLSDSRLVIQATRPMSTGVYRPKRQDFRQIAVGGGTPTTLFLALPEYETIFGALAVGQTVFFRYSLVSTVTGQTSNMLDVQVTVTA